MDGKITWVPLYFFEEYIKVSSLSDSKAGKRYKDLLKTCIDGKTDGEFGILVKSSNDKMAKLREKAQKGAEKRWKNDTPSNAPCIAPSNAPCNAQCNATGYADREEKKREEKKREEEMLKWESQFGNKPISEEQKKEFFSKVGVSLNG